MVSEFYCTVFVQACDGYRELVLYHILSVIEVCVCRLVRAIENIFYGMFSIL